jgi:hypothetical protein
MHAKKRKCVKEGRERERERERDVAMCKMLG